jgi:hypothetical protein
MKGYFGEFAYALGQRESGNDYKALNSFGYVGRWQFGKMRLYDLGYSLNGYAPPHLNPKKIIAIQDFLNDSELQDKLFRKHIEQHTRYVTRHFSDQLGKIILGVEITLSGLVAGIHLKGIGGVRMFLQGVNNKDGYGTEITEYIEKFGGYELTDAKIADEDIPKPKGIETPPNRQPSR